MKVLVLSCLALALVQIAIAIPKWRTSKGLKQDWNSREVQEWCDEVLGCLILDDTWYWPNRPINVLPDSREKINTRFIIHTRANPGENGDTYISADTASIDVSTFDPSKPIKFITHGFIDTGFVGWMMDMVRGFLSHGDYNVIRTDWGGGSLPMYMSAAANTRVVGLEIAYLVNFLIDNYGVDPANVHLLGHSLGSHTSGYAGERIAGLGRITGMDPAGPYYTETPAYIRIDETDAAFVDNIHTDADHILMLGYGTEQEMGHLDFYPNSGHDQPGCDPVTIGIEVITDLPDGIRDLAACSHQRATELYADSLYMPCPYLARECVDYESFEQGRCATCGDDDSKCAYMGEMANQYPYQDRVNVRLWFDTDEVAPYCYYHYQIVVDTAHPKEAEDWVQGKIWLWLYGDNGEVIEDIQITKDHERFDHGQLRTFLLTSHTDLSRVIRMEIKWEYDSSLTNPGSYCWMLLCNRALYLRAMVISPMDYYPEANRLDHQRSLCQVGSEFAEIKSGDTEVLTSDDTCVFYV